MITAKMRCTGHSSYSITRDRGAPEVADSGGPPAMGRWAGGASPPLRAAMEKALEPNTVRDRRTSKRPSCAERR